MSDLVDAMRAALRDGDPAVLVRVAMAQGSTPREAGAAMLVTIHTSSGTVGGGALELAGIAEARRMIALDRASSALDIPLGPALGQCCGGRVLLSLDRLDAVLLANEIAAAEDIRQAQPAVVIYGAGHTGRALAVALAPLPLAVRLVDTRPDVVRDLPEAIAIRITALPEAEVEQAVPGTAFLVMTHDHGLDFLIAAAALRRGDAAYVGMIGSRTKRQKFRRYLSDIGEEHLSTGLTLPIGGASVRDKRPAVIAALTAAELVTVLLARPEEKQVLPFAPATERCNSDQIENSISKAAPHARAS